MDVHSCCAAARHTATEGVVQASFTAMLTNVGCPAGGVTAEGDAPAQQRHLRLVLPPAVDVGNQAKYAPCMAKVWCSSNSVSNAGVMLAWQQDGAQHPHRHRLPQVGCTTLADTQQLPLSLPCPTPVSPIVAELYVGGHPHCAAKVGDGLNGQHLVLVVQHVCTAGQTEAGHTAVTMMRRMA